MSMTQESTRLSRRASWGLTLVGLALIVAAAGALVPSGSSPPRSAHAAGTGPAARAGRDNAVVRQSIVHEGIRVEMTIDPINRDAAADAVLREGDDVVIQFKIADTTSGAPLKNVYPAAWMTDRGPGTTSQKECVAKVQVLLGGSLLSPPELDLNVYHIVTLNEDATLTVVNPRFGFGGTKLLAVVPLAGVGQDWALSRDESRLFVSMPQVGKVAVIDTSTWLVKENLEVGPLPTRSRAPARRTLPVGRPRPLGDLGAFADGHRRRTRQGRRDDASRPRVARDRVRSR